MLSTILDIYIASTFTPPTTEANSPTWDPGNVITVAKTPEKTPTYVAPVIKAKSALIADLETGTILYEKNINNQLPIASITKLMTAIIILEENKLDEIVTVSSKAAGTGGSKIWLYSGEKIKVKDLLYAILIHSGNDAAIALAEHNAGSVKAFVEKMNKKAAQLKLYNTKFANPIGFDDEENYSTAHEVIQLGRYAFKKDFIKHAASIEDMTISSTNKKFNHDLENTNSLLDSYLTIKGLKTGRTDNAGLCLVSVAANAQNREIITVVLNSPDRFKETKILTDWAFKAYTW